MLKARKLCGRTGLLSVMFMFVFTATAACARSWYFTGSPSYYYAPQSAGVPVVYGGTPSACPGYTVPGTAAATDYLSSVCEQGTYTWQPEKMPIKVWIADGTGEPGYKPIFQTYVRNGFDAWCAASGNKLSWTEVSNPNQADVTVRWTDRVTERPEGTEAGRTSALTRLNPATGKGIIYGARMQFLTRLPERLFADEEVEKTCLHEAGHAMGLQGHSPYRDDIMYFAVSPTPHPMLSARDRNTIAKLYAGAPALTEITLGNKTQSPVLEGVSR